jgi:hypothetical protein
MMRAMLKTLRTRVLRWINRRRMGGVMRAFAGDSRMPVYIIASPPDMHFVPLALLNGSPRVLHMVVANGVGRKAVAWIRSQVGEVPVIALKASLRRESASYLPHAEVVRLCEMASHADFGIQDADCFVTRSAWWDNLRALAPGEFAAGPFRKPAHRLEAWMPDTFLVVINREAYRRREAWGIRPDISAVNHPRLVELLRARGIEDEYYPDSYNKYFDTLQMHWVAAILEGEVFAQVPGADEEVFHIGGSTYLTGSNNADPRHWDYWPLNTAYFNLRVLESPRFAAVRGQGSWLFSRYGSADKLLEEFPDFRNSRRYQQSQRLLAGFESYLNRAD